MGNSYLGKDEFGNLSDTVWKHDKDRTLQDWTFCLKHIECVH